MAEAEVEYQKLVKSFADGEEIVASQMFGKPCLKVGGKAFVAHHRDTIAFKLDALHHGKALALPGAVLWDPSGKGRPMKEWVALPATAASTFKGLAGAALEYVRSKG
jgi:hypothetical protein